MNTWDALYKIFIELSINLTFYLYITLFIYILKGEANK